MAAVATEKTSAMTAVASSTSGKPPRLCAIRSTSRPIASWASAPHRNTPAPNPPTMTRGTSLPRRSSTIFGARLMIGLKLLLSGRGTWTTGQRCVASR